MAGLDALAALTGPWEGPYELRVDPREPARNSSTTARVNTVAAGKLVTISYDWLIDDETQDGLILVGCHEQRAEVSWCDSWHMDTRIMQLHGDLSSDGGITARGEWQVPGESPWGWRIDVSIDGPDAFSVAMYNVTPQGEEYLAVRASYRPSRAG